MIARLRKSSSSNTENRLSMRRTLFAGPSSRGTASSGNRRSAQSLHFVSATSASACRRAGVQRGTNKGVDDTGSNSISLLLIPLGNAIPHRQGFGFIDCNGVAPDNYLPISGQIQVVYYVVVGDYLRFRPRRRQHNGRCRRRCNVNWYRGQTDHGNHRAGE